MLSQKQVDTKMDFTIDCVEDDFWRFGVCSFYVIIQSDDKMNNHL